MTHARTAGNAFEQPSTRRSGMLVAGHGEPFELRAAVAWAAIPLLVSGAMYFAALALSREPTGNNTVVVSLLSAAQSMLRLGEVFFILGLWRFAILFACSGETKALPQRQSFLIRAVTAMIVVSALLALAIVMLAPAATSLHHAVAATALAA